MYPTVSLVPHCLPHMSCKGARLLTRVLYFSNRSVVYYSFPTVCHPLLIGSSYYLHRPFPVTSHHAPQGRRSARGSARMSRTDILVRCTSSQKIPPTVPKYLENSESGAYNVTFFNAATSDIPSGLSVY